MQAARWLISRQIPFGVVTREGLSRLQPGQVLVLSNVLMMSDEEAAAIREFVRRGGRVYASGSTSLVGTDGRRRADFALGDLFGVRYQRGDWRPRDHYLAPTENGAPLFVDFTHDYPAFVNAYGMEVQARDGVEVLATTTLPWPAPDPSRFASIHSNPPWLETTNPEIVRRRHGDGRCIYASTVLEGVETLGPTFVNLIQSLRERRTLEIRAHPSVEATLFDQQDRRRFLLTLVVFQKELPNLPVPDVRVTVRPSRPVRSVRTIGPAGRGVLRDIAIEAGEVRFRLPVVNGLAMLALEE
jgi:hypothetical protein